MRLLSMKILIFPFKKRENIYFKFKYLSQPHSSKFGDQVKSHFHLCKKSHLLFPRVLKQVENLSCFKCILHTTKETLNIFNSIQNLVSNVIDNICCCWHFFFQKSKKLRLSKLFKHDDSFDENVSSFIWDASKQFSGILIFKRWPSLWEHLFDHLLWSLFHSSSISYIEHRIK